jgi:YHS domain-containing protein
MKRWQWFARAIVVVAAALSIECLASAIWAQSNLEYPRPCPDGCVPNYKNFGYFRQQWRRWPGEPGLDETNPRAIGSQVLPTPEGSLDRSPRKIVPPSPYRQPVPQPPQPRPDMGPAGSQAPPQSILPPTPEGDLPPEGAVIRPPEGTLLPPPELGKEMPKPAKETTKPEKEGPKPTTPKPSTESELPGLPEDEPTPPKSPAPSKGKSSDLMPIPQDTPAQAAERLPGVRSRPEKPQDSWLPDTRVAQQEPQDRLPELEPLRQDKPQPRAAANPLVSRTANDSNDSAVVALANNLEPERNSMPPVVSHADSIGVVSHPSADRIEPAGYATADSSGPSDGVGAKVTPTVALNGYCPVELNRNGRWVKGNARWTVVHQGWIYRLSGAKQRQEFLADPERFAPVNAGNDVVLMADQNRAVPGKPAHCAVYNDRLYMFSSEATQAEFNRRPERYTIAK